MTASNRPPQRTSNKANNVKAKSTLPQQAPGKNPATTTPGKRPITQVRGQVSGNPARKAVNKRKRGFKMSPIDFALVGAGLLLVIAIIWFGINSTQSSANSTQNKPFNLTPIPAGQVAPPFNLPATDGKSYSLAQFKGKVVLLEFMAPWCPHCQQDAPLLNQTWDKYKDKAVQFLGMNASPYGKNYDNGDNTHIAMTDQQWFHDNFALQYPLMLDNNVEIADLYAAHSFPTIYIIDKTGNIASRVAPEASNPITVERLSTELDKVLK